MELPLAACCLLLAACCLLLAAAKPGRSSLDTKKGYKTKTCSTSSVTLTLTPLPPSPLARRPHDLRPDPPATRGRNTPPPRPPAGIPQAPMPGSTPPQLPPPPPLQSFERYLGGVALGPVVVNPVCRRRLCDLQAFVRALVGPH